MKISGEKIKTRRKALGLSQSELADKICTQATISLIEKKNKVPSMEILINICDRLELNIDSVIEEDENQISNIFKRAEKYMADLNYEGINEVIGKIDESQLTSSQELKQYYFFKAYIELKLNKNYDKAIFIYTRAFNISTHSSDFFDTLINIYISQAYLGKNAYEEAEIYAKQTQEVIDSNYFKEDDTSINKLLIYKNIANVYQTLKNDELAIHYAKMGIIESKKRKSYFLLDYFYLILAELENDKFALTAAYVISSIMENKEIYKEIRNIAEKRNIEL
ncbi:helix-turn-helix domain-containing protein [Companilactobacillus sp. DQM5]|uniref:helix-turn-helix domain-containing protein n=1 Tax=Companilactobacillus sp. DQM5 TaxID=3463359 RepID=UPI0040580A36